MVNKKYVAFLMEIIRETKQKKITWEYLDKNKRLYEGMNWTHVDTQYGFFVNKETVSPDFNSEESFCSKVNNYNLVIYVYKNQPPVFYIIPSTFKSVVTLTSDEYGEYIVRLSNLVKSQFPNAETFIDEFLHENLHENNED